MIGRWHGLVIDCPDPSALATFYEQVLGMQRVQDEGHWVVIGDAPDRPGLAFQGVAELRAPQWPDGDQQQQMHLDVRVTDLMKRRSGCWPWAHGACPVVGNDSGSTPIQLATRSAWCPSEAPAPRTRLHPNRLPRFRRDGSRARRVPGVLGVARTRLESAG
jgi:Glyoxalase-like domain